MLALSMGYAHKLQAMNTRISFPIDDVLGALIDALRLSQRAVLQAPPGAGKTTRVPLAMMDAKLTDGRILMLEPRRLAARAAAEWMAETLGETVGQTVGYRIRGESRVSPSTRIEVVTEGILTRMIQSDPSLEGVGALIFDEFHERSLNADLGLALAWEIKEAFRDDLIIVVMSATLDAKPVADLLGAAPLITSDGRAFDVDTIYLPTPIAKTERFEHSAANLIRRALGETQGGVLVFLPGEAEIRRVERILRFDLAPGNVLHPLFGALPFKDQRAAIRKSEGGRKIVLATSIAETSLTIEDIRVVIDCGRARRSRFDPGSGMSRLVTEKVTRAEADQRRGRAGRVAQGACYRMWTKGEEGALRAFPPAEIEAADLTGFALDLAFWGVASPIRMAFLTPPNNGVLGEAQKLLVGLGALDPDMRITDHGKAMARLPLHPRLAHMLLMAGPSGAPVAAILSERDPLPRGTSVDFSLRIDAIKDARKFEREYGITVHRAATKRISAENKRLARLVRGGKDPDLSIPEMIALAYPDRIGKRRAGDQPRWVLSGGKGVAMDPGDQMAGFQMIIATDLDGDTTEANIRQAVVISETRMRSVCSDAITWVNKCEWSRRDSKVIARQEERLGAIVLTDRRWHDAPTDAISRAALEGVRDLGLPLTVAAQHFANRVELLRAGGDNVPEMTEAALLETAENWLLPYLSKVRTAGDIQAIDITEALKSRLKWNDLQQLDQLAPSHFKTPLGNRVAIDYAGDHPSIELRLQELFGVDHHPVVGTDRIPLRITLLSPARRPVQVTLDLPGFWAKSYGEVRKEMRGRYPKHPWPENPAEALPTLRTKRKGR